MKRWQLLDKGRHLMEMNYMLAYGSAEPSLRLLWRFGLLELLLPIQAAYFVRDGLRRRDKKTNMLLTLFSNMDKLLAPDRPCHSSLWVAIFALHMAFLDRPRDPLVVAAFSLAVHNGGDMEEAIGIAKRISTPHATIYAELSDSQYLEPKALKKEVLELEVSVSKALSNMTDSYYVSQAMRTYPKAPKSDMAIKIFECVNQGNEARFVAKQGGEIDYKSLAMGNAVNMSLLTLASQIIKALHDYDGKIGQKVKSCYPSLWLDIIHEYKRLRIRPDQESD
nr:polynucleotide adenylyltransferase family protein [Tanacetum cinerariifolium]